ncbi:MAG: S-layer homology domain-containing protein [Clostridia bacterium]|nr:S-layer homology domain-containing protein [Clostridia bacterium]
MKRVISIALVLLMLLCVSGGVLTASAEENNSKYVLAGFDLIDVHKEEATVTRGEFAGIVARLLGFSKEELSPVETSYYDVSSDYEYAAEIELLSQMGMLNGVSNGIFEPLSSVTYEQAIKVLVEATGYGDLAEREGGYPKGYITIAIRNKMLGGVILQNPFERDSLYRLVHNTLDVEILEKIISTNSNEVEVKSGRTLMDELIYADNAKLYKHKGVIVADSYTYTTSPYEGLCDDEVIIENKTAGQTLIYNIGKTAASSYVGCEVEFYSKETPSGYVLLSVRPTNKNEVIRVVDEKFDTKSAYSIFYRDENDKSRKLTLESGFKLIYNGSRIINPQDSEFDITDGYFEFINNDEDKSFEIVMVWEYENAIAQSFDGSRFNFAPNATYNGQPALFVDITDPSVKIRVTDSDSNIVNSFSEERVVSIFRDRNNTRYTIRVSSAMLSGKIDGLDERNISIDGKYHAVANSFGTDFKVGQKIEAYIDYNGKLAFFKELGESNYGYIFNYGSEGNLSTKYKVMMIIPDKVDDGVEKNEEDVTDTSSVPYLILHNSGTKKIPLAETVKCEGTRYRGEEQLNLLSRPDVKAVKYVLDENGCIKELVPLEQHGGDLSVRYEYDVYNRVFGGSKVPENSGFALNSETVGVCIPVDQDGNVRYDAAENDFGVKINITVANNKTGYRVAGYDYDEETKKVGMIVHLASMESDLAGSVSPYNGKCSIVKSVNFVLDSESGEYVQQIEILSGGTTENLLTIPNANSAIRNLKQGDVITYTKNSNNLLSNVHVIQSISALKGYINRENTSQGYLYLFGKVENLQYELVDTVKKRLYTEMELNTGSGAMLMEIPNINTPPIYIYNKESGDVTSGSYKDIRPFGDDAFIFKPKGSTNIRVIVIVR